MARPLEREPVIRRDLHIAAGRRYDLAVIGGGIHGAQLALAASERGLAVLVLEAADFGGGASGNSLRILHGGLRYLQSMDLPRFMESVAQRRWHAQAFADLVEPLACLMPLYAQGLKRRSVMRVALAMNDVLSKGRNAGLAARLHLPDGHTLDVAQTVSQFPQVRRPQLEGGAIWYDYFMRSSERILIETLHRACALGAEVLNYARLIAMHTEQGRVVGLSAEDALTGQPLEFAAQRICNCTGSDARALAGQLDREYPELFVPSLAFNVLFECQRLGPNGLAVAAPDPGAPMYFLCPSPHGIWAGTEHVARPDDCTDPTVQEAELDAFIGRINRAIPGLNLSLQNVRRVCSGLLPVRRVQSVELTGREVIIDHAHHGAARGLYSATGIKFTTARKVARKALATILGSDRAAGESVSETWPALRPATPQLTDGALAERLSEAELQALVRTTAADESALTADDFCLRRTNWQFTARDFSRLRRIAAEAMAAAITTPQSGAIPLRAPAPAMAKV
ncbi:MAG TPA: FAD-dependent oxidoreductase [Steroidobacteraceae bacterium]